MAKKSLENKFDEAVKKAQKKIDQCIKKAEEALSEAEKVSEEYGVPFYASVSPIYQQYTPMSYREKWGDLDPEYTEVFENYAGWQHSDVC